MTTSTYSFIDTLATFTGPGASISLGNGNAVAEAGITIKLTGDKNKQTNGADGTVMNTLIASNSGMVEVTLLQTSPQNAQLQEAYNAQRIATRLWGNNVITVSQTGLGDVHVCTGVAFKRQPDTGYQTDGGTRTWQFDAANIVTKLGAIEGGV